MSFKKISMFFLAFVFLPVPAWVCVPAWAALPDEDIVILYTNDVHCGVDENIGYAGLAFYRDEMKKRTPYVTLVDAGDAVQGAVIGTISNGRYIIEIMNALGYDVAVPGNHEFDYGMGQFENFAKNLKCGYVSCNFRRTGGPSADGGAWTRPLAVGRDLATGRPVFEPYKIISYGNTKVAFVGVCTPQSITSSTPSSFMDAQGNYIYDFDGDLTGEKLCASVQRAVESARAEGADFVILVAHLGEDAPVKAWSAPHVVENTRGIDAVIDGHSHEVTPSLKVKNLDGVELPITQSGTKLKYIGQVTIDTSGKITTGLIDSVSGRDGEITALIRSLKDRYEDTLRTPLGKADFDLVAGSKEGGWLLRNAETNLCNFATDAFLAAAAAEGAAVDIALINAGGIRATMGAGELTFRDALAVFPFGNTLCVCDVPGQTILDELEFGAALMPKNFSGLLHTAGLTYTIDATIPTPVQVDDKNMFVGIPTDAPRRPATDGRIHAPSPALEPLPIRGQAVRRVRDVMVNGEPLDPSRTYSVVSVSYALLGRGDGHRFEGARMTKPDFITAADAIARFIKGFPSIPQEYRIPQGRMRIIR